MENEENNHSGYLEIRSALNEEQLSYLKEFFKVEDGKALKNECLPNSQEEFHNRVGLGLGIDGEFFVGPVVESYIFDDGLPADRPSKSCPFAVSDCGTKLLLKDGNIDRGEAVSWAQYLYSEIFSKWGLTLHETSDNLRFEDETGCWSFGVSCSGESTLFYLWK